jgi:hypothetical protein
MCLHQVQPALVPSFLFLLCAPLLLNQDEYSNIGIPSGFMVVRTLWVLATAKNNTTMQAPSKLEARPTLRCALWLNAP